MGGCLHGTAQYRRPALPGCEPYSLEEELTMLYWALLFFIVALVAAVFGFGTLAGTAAGIAKFLFFVFLVLFIVSLIFGGLRRPI
jgi:uncharacterized membrane protein YtjA (UPF0391 family)